MGLLHTILATGANQKAQIVLWTLTVHHKKHTQLELQVKQLWEVETIYLRKGIAVPMVDKKVLALWDDEVKKVCGHYQLPIPFKQDPPGLPDNKGLAERRLEGLKKRLCRAPQLHQRYTEEVQLLLSKGYAELVPMEELYANPGRRWYLPHHPVFNPNKPEKVRIVFDCAAEHASVSLNSQVWSGPDLTNKLLGVLLGF